MSKKYDAELLEELYALYENSMYYQAYSVLHDTYLAEDAVHEAFLRIIRRIDRISDPSSPKTKAYVKKALHSCAVDIYRKKRRESYNTTALYENEEEKYYDTYDTDAIEAMLEALPKKYADVILCIVIHGLTAKECAAVLGTSEVCVRKRFERAKKILRAEINRNAISSVTEGKVRNEQ